jgi:hypothetical protein
MRMIRSRFHTSPWAFGTQKIKSPFQESVWKAMIAWKLQKTGWDWSYPLALQIRRNIKGELFWRTWQGWSLRPAQKVKCKLLMTSVLHNCGNYKEAHSSSRPYINCKVSRINEDYKAADLNDRPKLFSSHSLSICSVDSTDDGKLGYGFTLMMSWLNLHQLRNTWEMYGKF